LYLLQSDREIGIDGMKYYFSWERIKEQHGVCVCGWGEKLFFFMFFVYYIYCTTLLIYGIVERKKKNSFA
jgi:hypothetical protein